MYRPFDEQWREYEDAIKADIHVDPAGWLYSRMRHERKAYKWYFLNWLNLAERLIVARGKSQTDTKKTTPSREGWTQFVNIPLSADDGAAMRKYYEDAGKLYTDFMDLLMSQHRVSYSYDAQRDAVICTVTCKDERSKNAGKTYTSFANDWYTALMCSMYKHYVVSDTVWGDDDGKKERPEFG